MEAFKQDFNLSVRQVLAVWGVPDDAVGPLVQLLSRHDLNNKTPEQVCAPDLSLFLPRRLRSVETIEKHLYFCGFDADAD